MKEGVGDVSKLLRRLIPYQPPRRMQRLVLKDADLKTSISKGKEDLRSPRTKNEGGRSSAARFNQELHDPISRAAANPRIAFTNGLFNGLSWLKARKRCFVSFQPERDLELLSPDEYGIDDLSSVLSTSAIKWQVQPSHVKIQAHEIQHLRITRPDAVILTL